MLTGCEEITVKQRRRNFFDIYGKRGKAVAITATS